MIVGRWMGVAGNGAETVGLDYGRLLQRSETFAAIFPHPHPSPLTTNARLSCLSSLAIIVSGLSSPGTRRILLLARLDPQVIHNTTAPLR